jgi:DNA polymerase-1
MQGLFDNATLHSVPVPETGWRPPVDFPRLEAAVELSIDLETYDPELMTHGPGWGRGVGHIVGVGVGARWADRSIKTWYFPMRHELPDGMPAPGNFDPGMVLRWVEREFSRPTQPKIGANLEYDTGWLSYEGVEVTGELIDVQYAEPLLDEHRHSYSLDAIATSHLNEHKIDEVLYDWLHRAYGGPTGRKQAGNIYRAPLALVGPYGEGDVDLPLRGWERQRPRLEAEGLMELVRMECDLIPILVKMRMRGMPLNEAKLQPNIDIMEQRLATAKQGLKKLVGFEVNPDASSDLVRAFDTLKLEYPTTKKGNPSFRKEFLEAHPHEIGHHIREVRRWGTYLGFANSYRDKFNNNGIIHGSYHPLRSDEGGTVVGRFSSSNPNLTNIPVRDPEAKLLLRGMFGPWDGERYRSRDYSQIQFRIMVHYAQGKGADEARAKYRSDPATDYHNMTQALIHELTGQLLDRKPVKNINFGLAFTMGLEKLAKNLGMTTAATLELLESYHAGMPWLKHTSGLIANKAEQRGYIMGIGKRRHRFTLWEPKCWPLRHFVKPSEDKVAVEQRIAELIAQPPKGIRGRLYPGTQRAYTHLGLNRLAQDGEGTTIKRAMVACHKAGIYDIVGVPLNTVHDEINHSDPVTAASEDAFREMKHIMETTTQWKVPLMVGDEVGPNWAELAKLV